MCGWLFWLGMVGLVTALPGCADKTDEGDPLEKQLSSDSAGGVDNALDSAAPDSAASADTGCTGPDCDSTDEPDSGLSSGSLPTETTVYSVAWGCTETNYFYEVYTVGWSTGGWLFSYQNYNNDPDTDWSEDHPILVYENDLDGYWSHLYLDLAIVYPNAGEQESGVSTLYTCDAKGEQHTLTFVVEVDDRYGNEAVDCVVWGFSPDSVDADECERVTAGTAEPLR